MTKAQKPAKTILYTAVVAAVSVLAGCGSGRDGGSSTVTTKGVVTSAA